MPANVHHAETSMTEFTSEMKREKRPAVLLITLAVAAVALVLAWAVIRYQKNHPPPKEAAGTIAVPGMVHAGDPEFESYKASVRLEDVRATIGIPVAGPRFALIDGVISNEGNRIVEAVEMHITLFDVYGKFSKEATRVPFRPGIGIEYRSLAPLEKRAFHFGVESVEQLWDPKRVEIKVSGFKLK
jgi:hypothetical protein